MDLAPIALFVYNRPEHVRKAIQALQRNKLAQESELFVFSDGPKSDSCPDTKVAEVRAVIRNIAGFKNLTIIEQDQNKGLADSIIEGVSDIVDKYGKIIVLEDDLVVSPSFLKFMNDALHRYSSEEQVMHVSGYFWPVPGISCDSFFLSNISSWGWATWSRSWKYFNSDAKQLLEEITVNESQARFNLGGSRPFYEMLHSQAYGGGVDSWAIRWYASIFLLQGLSLFPRRSFVQNEGMDGSGTHCSSTDSYETTLFEENLTLFDSIVENRVVKEQLIKFFHQINSRERPKNSLLSLRKSIIKSIKMILR